MAPLRMTTATEKRGEDDSDGTMLDETTELRTGLR